MKLLALKLILVTLGQFVVSYCPTGDIPEECICYGTTITTISCSAPVSGNPWNMKKTFDDLTEVYNGTNPDEFTDLFIYGHRLKTPQPIVGDTVAKLRFRRINIYSQGKFTKIDPNAFSGSHSTLRVELAIYAHKFDSTAFELFRNFKHLKSVSLLSNSILPTIPEDAFSGFSSYFDTFSLANLGIESIEDFAFSNLNSKITSINLNGNLLTDSGISDNAFANMSNAGISIKDNYGLTHLPQRKFKSVLDRNTGNLTVGATKSDDSKYFLRCNESADWICSHVDKYKNNLKGFNCIEREYVDVFQYCRVSNQAP